MRREIGNERGVFFGLKGMATCNVGVPRAGQFKNNDLVTVLIENISGLKAVTRIWGGTVPPCF